MSPGLPPPPSGLELQLYPHIATGDGGAANNGWLLEFPDPITRISWGGAVSIAPRRFDEMGLANGDLVAHHIYSFKELEALQKGGVQRIYTGNIPTGRHEINVVVAGKLSSGQDISETATFSFDKQVEPKMIGVELANLNAGSRGIQLGEW